MNRFSRLLRLSVLALALSSTWGCRQPVTAQTAPMPQPIKVSSRETSRVLEVKKFIYKIQPGAVYFNNAGGWECYGHSQTWDKDKIDQIGAEVTKDTMMEMLRSYGYRTVDGKGVFNKREQADSDLQLGGEVGELYINGCMATKKHLDRGYIQMIINWEVLDTASDSIVYRKSIPSVAEFNVPDRMISLEALISKAMYNSLGALLGQRDFYALATSEGGGDAKDGEDEKEEVKAKPVSIPTVRSFSGSMEKNIDAVRAGTVTILQGDTHGSGFAISHQGHIMTNAHVVGDARRVQVKFPNGRKYKGEVLRLDRERDAALIQVEEEHRKRLTPLPIRLNPPEVSSPVYAIGSPRDVQLSSTVTRGIISAFRKTKGKDLPWIQSDVTVQGGNSGGPLLDEHGNVIGITTKGEIAGHTLEGARVGTGINFFIPIEDALDRLDIRLK
ncbi:MAG: trypsin-like peptidase domain-containing protein [Magnetococcales bacterium]|nr:trypsin-like peptidase domain-containing protein [Magnetococcales bacterium]